MKMTSMKKKLVLAALVVSAVSIGSFGAVSPVQAVTPTATLTQALQMKEASISDLDNDTRVFAIDKDIEAKNVRFQNHYGYTVAGHLYLPKNFDVTKQYKAIVVSGPFGAVKEQSSGLYAQELAKNGFVSLAFDPSMTGESSGTRRNVGSPDIFTEDYHAGVDFLSNLDFVNKDEIGAMGICGLSGMAITAGASDPRIKAVATSAMYDMSESIGDHYKGAYYTPEQRAIVQKHVADLRTEEARTGKEITGAHELGVDVNGNVQTFTNMFPKELPADADPVSKEFYGYYVKRAYHPRAINSYTSAWDGSTPTGFYDFNLMDNISEIGDKPVLMITGSAAHSKYFTDDVMKKFGNLKNKREIVVPGATHTDLYDQMDKIPFRELVSFFNKNL